MSILRRMKKSKRDEQSSGANAEGLMERFEKEIERQDDLLYGMALFFEGISILYAGQAAVIETYRKQFRNSILTGKNVVQQASALLELVKKDPGKARQIEQFRFSLCSEHPEPEKMLKRSEILVRTYDRIFPGRSRSQPFDDNETLRLIETASEDLAKVEDS